MDYAGISCVLLNGRSERNLEVVKREVEKYTKTPILSQYIFREIEKLGSGIQGDAYHSKVGPFVLKISEKDNEIVNREYRIGTALANLRLDTFVRMFSISSCDNIAHGKRVNYCLQDTGVHYLVMENIIMSNPLSTMYKKIHLDEFKIILVEILMALEKAHDKYNFVHNDLNSNNIMIQRWIDGSLRPVIIDFGLATMDGNEQQRDYSHVSFYGRPFRDIRTLLNMAYISSWDANIKKYVNELMFELTGKGCNEEMVSTEPHRSTLPDTVNITYSDVLDLMRDVPVYTREYTEKIDIYIERRNLLVDYYNDTFVKNYINVYKDQRVNFYNYLYSMVKDIQVQPMPPGQANAVIRKLDMMLHELNYIYAVCLAKCHQRLSKKTFQKGLEYINKYNPILKQSYVKLMDRAAIV